MSRTRWTTVLACLGLAALISWAVSDLVLSHRGWVPALTPWTAAVALGVSTVVLVCGLAVRRLRAHEPTWITPSGAATTAAAAQASALCGAVLGGVYLGELVAALLAPRSPAMDELAWVAVACGLAGLVWLGVGLLVEHWCAIDMSDDDDEHDSQGGGVPRGSQPA